MTIIPSARIAMKFLLSLAYLVRFSSSVSSSFGDSVDGVFKIEESRESKRSMYSEELIIGTLVLDGFSVELWLAIDEFDGLETVLVVTLDDLAVEVLVETVEEVVFVNFTVVEFFVNTAVVVVDEERVEFIA